MSGGNWGRRLTDAQRSYFRTSSPATGFDPKTFLPGFSWRDGLKGGIFAGVVEVEDVGDGGHRFEADHVAAGGREDYRDGVLGAETHCDLLGLAFHGEFPGDAAIDI